MLLQVKYQNVTIRALRIIYEFEVTRQNSHELKAVYYTISNMSYLVSKTAPIHAQTQSCTFMHAGAHYPPDVRQSNLDPRLSLLFLPRRDKGG